MNLKEIHAWMVVTRCIGIRDQSHRLLCLSGAYTPSVACVQIRGIMHTRMLAGVWKRTTFIIILITLGVIVVICKVFSSYSNVLILACTPPLIEAET